MAIQSFENSEFTKEEKQQAAGKNLIRACLFNLVIVSHTPSRVAHCQELIRVITEKYPCKIIFVQQDSAAQSEYVRVTPKVQSTGTAANPVLCDVIQIETSSTEAHKIPLLILPQIVPDLPVYVVLGYDPTEQSNLLQDLATHVSRIVYDCDVIASYSSFAERLLSMAQSTKNDYIDLNWARTKAWRETLARAFNRPEVLQQLALSKMIQISYVEPLDHKIPNCEAQAVYIQAWLAQKMKWQLLTVEKEDPYIRIAYKYDHTPLTISLVPKDTDILPPGSLFSFEAMTQGDYHFLLSHENDSKLVKVHSSNPDRCEMPYTIFLANFQNGPALVNEVLYQEHGSHYNDMLQYLAKAAWK